jgi:hypothetical protein
MMANKSVIVPSRRQTHRLKQKTAPAASVIESKLHLSGIELIG